jgi:hypothetical protein
MAHARRVLRIPVTIVKIPSLRLIFVSAERRRERTIGNNFMNQQNCWENIKNSLGSITHFIIGECEAVSQDQFVLISIVKGLVTRRFSGFNNFYVQFMGY